MKSSDSLNIIDDCSDTQKRSPSFFKIMLQDFKNVLFIPPKFAWNIGRLVKQTVSLHNSNGNSWNVKISVITGRLAFQDGWCDFVRDHSITEGEFVVFRYRGHSVFSVNIWGIDACERTWFVEKIKNGNIEVRREASVFDCEKNHLSKKQRTSEASETKCKFEKFGSMKKASKEKNFSEKYDVRDLIQLNEVVRKFLVTEDGVCHVFYETLIYVIAPNMSTQQENSAYGQGKEKPQGMPSILASVESNDPPNMSSMLKYHKHDRIMRRFSGQSVQGPHRNRKQVTEKDPPFLKGKSIQQENSAYGQGKEKPQGMPSILASVESNDPPNVSSMLKYHKHARIMRRFSGQSVQGPHRNRKQVTEKDPPFLKGKSIQVKPENMNVKTCAPLPSPDFVFSLSN